MGPVRNRGGPEKNLFKKERENDIETKKKLDLICHAAYDRKAEDIVIMEMGERSAICEYFVLMSAPSSVRVKAIVEHVETSLEKEGLRLRHKEGHRDAVWVLMDYGDIIAHVFYHDMRKFYDIERLWGDVPKRKYLNHSGPLK